jgi:CheY-like chemotaxis protein
VTTRGRVLVIENDADIRTAISEILVVHGYSVSEAADGEEGLGRAGEDQPDLILLDLNMPRMDGWAFRRAQQGQPRLAHIPVVVVSACAVDQACGVGAEAHLEKPFRLDDLLHLVARFCNPETAASRWGQIVLPTMPT